MTCVSLLVYNWQQCKKQHLLQRPPAYCIDYSSYTQDDHWETKEIGTGKHEHLHNTASGLITTSISSLRAP